MAIAVIALAAALLSPQDLGAANLGWTDARLDENRLAQVVVNVGASALSLQKLTNQVSEVRLTSPPGGQLSVRTGEATLGEEGTSGFAGVQALSVSTGIGSSVQTAVSVAAGVLSLGAKP